MELQGFGPCEVCQVHQPFDGIYRLCFHTIRESFWEVVPLYKKSSTNANIRVDDQYYMYCMNPVPLQSVQKSPNNSSPKWDKSSFP